jgi:DNA-binding transcriptional LysR family regulator
MELRQLEAFAAVAAELHFGRAAQHLHMSQPTLSELIQRLERELGTPLFTRTTRRVALTGAGSELLGRAKVILDELAAAKAAVRRIAAGDAGTVRVGITPPVAPVLGPHLRDALADQAPDVVLDLQRMWLPHLTSAIADGTIDVAITCGLVPDPEGVVGEVFCAEPLMVGLRPDHRLAGRASVSLADLADDVLGTPSHALFPAWALCQQQALAAAGVNPPTVVLDATDLTATAWTDQPGVDWILLIASLVSPRTSGVVRSVTPRHLVPFGLQWNPGRARTAAVARFVHLALSIEPPPGWHTQPGHLRH